MPPVKKTAMVSYTDISEARKGLPESRRRDVRLHIQQALAKSPGKFLSIREIADTPTGEYDGNPAKPSYGAISTNLFREGGVSGVESLVENGVKGARSIVVKKPRKVAKLRPEVVEANRAAGAAVANKSRTIVNFTSPQDAESRAHQGIIDRLASKAPTGETPPVPGVLRKRPGRQTLTLNKGTKTHEGILDRLNGVVYCNVMLEPSRQRQYAGDGTIEGCDEFVAWLNKKNGPYFDAKRFEIIEVVGANRDQRENSGINKFYNEWLDGAEEYRIASALRLMNEMYSIGFHRGGETGSWRFYHGTGNGDLHIKFLMEKAKISVRKAHEVFMDYLTENLGPEMTSKLDLVGEDWVKKVEEQEAKAKHANSEHAEYTLQA